MVQYVVEFAYRNNKYELVGFQEGGMLKGDDQMASIDKTVLKEAEKFANNLREAGLKESNLKFLITDSDFDFKIR